MTRNRNRRSNRNQNPISLLEDVPICNEIRHVAEALQNNNFNNLVIARPIGPGTVMLGIADEPMHIGDMVTFDHPRTTDTFHVRKLTQDEVDSFVNRDGINRVERIGRARREANTGEVIEFIIDQCCDYITIQDVNALPISHYLGSPFQKKHQLDEDYPHICYKCKKKLKYLEAWKEVKETKMTEEKFQHLWELEQIEFYCCSCYDREVRKENPSTHSISTPFRNSPSFFHQLMAERAERILWRGYDINPPSPIHINTLQALVRYAEMQFRSPPIVSNDFNTNLSHRTIIQHHFEINVCGSGPHIHRNINMVVTIENHSRFDDIPPVIDLTIHSDYITNVAVANLVVELIFHWASAKVLLKTEDEEWISLNDRQDGFISFLNEFIEERNTRSNERFHATYPQFPHIFRLNDEGNMRCRLCGLSHLDLEEFNDLNVRGPRADMIMYDGFHREYELSMSSLEPHEHNGISGAEQNELSYIDCFNHYLLQPHEHYFGPTGQELHCRYCGRSTIDIDAERNRRPAIQRRNILSDL